MASNLIAAGMATLTAKLQEHASDAAVYTRSGVGSVSCRVTRGKSLLRLAGDYGQARTVLWDNDFFVPPAALAAVAALAAPGATKAEPLEGDTLDVTFADGSAGRFEVSKPAIDEPCARLVDQGTSYRTHAKFLEAL